jgi:phage I-like protein
MSNRLLLAASAVSLDPSSVAEDGTSWIQLFTPGRNAARDGRIFEVGDQASMQAIVAATAARAGATDPVVDYDHQSIFGAVPGVGGRAAASGWMKAIEARPDGIWARVEWTAAAAAAIRAREYRYVSPTFLHTKAGDVRVIVNAALTNTPAFDLAEATAAAFIADLTQDNGETMKTVAKALGLAEDAAEDKILAAVTTLIQETASQKTLLASVASAAGQADATGDALVAAVQAATVPNPAKYVPLEMLTTANARIAELTATATAERVAGVVEAAIAAGKVTPAQKDWALGFAKADPAAFEAWAKAAPTIVAPGGKPGGGKPPPAAGAGDLGETDLAVCTALGIAPDTFKKTREAEEKR